METRANFIIIGLFAIFGVLGGLGFFVWLSSVQIDRQWAQYGILFDNVSGLDQSADVLFNGVGVGRVVGIRIWEKDPSKVYVAIEIDSNTPIAVDTVAQLESQGVTGVAYIALSGGSPNAERLTPELEGPPIIPSRQSSFQSLVSSAPDLLGDATALLKQLEKLTGPENQEYVRRILQNIDAATAGLDTALQDFSDISTSLRRAADEITQFTDGLDILRDSAQTTLGNADTSLATITDTFETANQTLDALQPTITRANEVLAEVQSLMENDLPPLADGLQTTLQNADTALGSANDAFARADGIMASDLGPVLSDTQQAMAAFRETMTTLNADIPGILTDLRAATAEGRGAIGAAGPGIRDFSRLASEARTLVRTLNDLARNINQNPTGFLLDNRVPEYRR
ncbi:MlaD family protein [Yoonia sediminilitoris]|uniref:ABC-type transporter Mla subunit MlaD n=1 Tax=Yoonia sediminilitoris TaxID=1286148 RepID=A0A2T6KIU2_9RHOB|nr:MlaD family protein [Yoonia sediminilitoris]PUB15637.1 ABC-type transporter Mla subunit MlaD [Yoonia sediminilitoris]RCW96246.1 ABC-type transporter Mla subunit MlaD [Yoonia sediminilitoris]